MTQYLVTTFKDSTGQPHEHFTAVRDNQTFTVVEAPSDFAKLSDQSDLMRAEVSE
ncbi:phage protein [Staphylococcus aureus]|uniref:DUF1381 domain-containing protein n=1 Tax=Staphylococcus aureus TaxID=1280 RepID=UPI00061B8F78|nr:DUF1381 domain-containing protein [Staphylococcus aureus]MDS6145534.1 hypothetical protein [Staphylococcus aureus subsp. aureus SA9080]MBG1438166.1 DUF1381 domain-containing protein [Staphylococcus aureus]MBG1507608.1 DUF1381 domain-containing protein [Staphylococcus aureus]MBN5729781.1 DUF1381 domain-containing protein [Staphylococcus aureus]MBN5786900.1 DUF1381 domain-containing protein [Staphylococcus aureus]